MIYKNRPIYANHLVSNHLFFTFKPNQIIFLLSRNKFNFIRKFKKNLGHPKSILGY